MRKDSIDKIVSELARVGNVPRAKRPALYGWWQVTRALVPPPYARKLAEKPKDWAARLHALAAQARPLWKQFNEADIQEALAADIWNELNTDLIAHAGYQRNIASGEVRKFILEFKQMTERLDSHARYIEGFYKDISVFPKLTKFFMARTMKRIVDFWQGELQRPPTGEPFVAFAAAVFEALEMPYARSTLKKYLSSIKRIPKSQ